MREEGYHKHVHKHDPSTNPYAASTTLCAHIPVGDGGNEIKAQASSSCLPTRVDTAFTLRAVPPPPPQSPKPQALYLPPCLLDDRREMTLQSVYPRAQATLAPSLQHHSCTVHHHPPLSHRLTPNGGEARNRRRPREGGRLCREQ